MFHELLQSRSDIFKVVTPPHFALVTFQIQPPTSVVANEVEATRAITQKVLDTVNASGAMLLTPTELDSIYVIRFVPGSPHTEAKHIDNAFQLLLDTAEREKKQMAYSHDSASKL